MDEMSIEAARPKLGEIVDRARFTGEPTQITRTGKPVAVVVSVDWLERTYAALAAYAGSDDPPVSAREVRGHVVTLIGLLSGMGKSDFRPRGEFGKFWEQLNEAVGKLAALLPENAVEVHHKDGDPRSNDPSDLELRERPT